MNSLIEFTTYGILVPLGVSIAVAFACRRLLPSDVGQRYALSLAMAAGFCAGYALLPSWAVWTPTRHYLWLPYFAIAAGVAGPLALASGLRPAERWIVYAGVSLFAAYNLVPSWPALAPWHPQYVLFLVCYFFALCVWLPPLVKRTSPTFLLAVLLSVAIVLALTITAWISLRYGQMAAVAAAALAGSVGANIFFRFEESSAQGLVPVFSLLVGGLAFVSYIELQSPLVGFLILPAAPAALWITSIISRWFSRRSAIIAIHLAGVLLVLVAGGAMIWFGSLAEVP